VKRALIVIVTLAAVALSMSSAQAGGVRVGIGIGIPLGGPVYRPYPSYCYPYYYPASYPWWAMLLGMISALAATWPIKRRVQETKKATPPRSHGYDRDGVRRG